MDPRVEKMAEVVSWAAYFPGSWTVYPDTPWEVSWSDTGWNVFVGAANRAFPPGPGSVVWGSSHKFHDTDAGPMDADAMRETGVWADDGRCCGGCCDGY